MANSSFLERMKKRENIGRNAVLGSVQKENENSFVNDEDEFEDNSENQTANAATSNENVENGGSGAEENNDSFGIELGEDDIEKAMNSKLNEDSYNGNEENIAKVETPIDLDNVPNIEDILNEENDNTGNETPRRRGRPPMNGNSDSNIDNSGNINVGSQDKDQSLARIQELESLVASLQEENNSKNKELEEANAIVGKLNSKIDVLNENIKDHLLTITNLTKENEDLKLTLNAEDDSRENFEEIKNDYEVALKDKDSQISNLKEQITDLNGKINGLNTQVEELNGQIEGFKANVETIDFGNNKKDNIASRSLDSSSISVASDVLAYVCTQTIQNLLETYKSGMYTPDFTQKLLKDYLDDKIDKEYPNPLFRELITEAITSETKDPYLKDLTEEVLKYVKGKDENN